MERILVVDDEPSITTQLARVIEDMGFEVVAHNDPLEAIRESGFQVVITDYMMPGINGAEFLERLRESNPEAVRVLITAADDFKVATQAVNRGEVFRMLGKPWRLAELRDTVQQAVDCYRLTHENRKLTSELAERNSQLSALNRSLELKVMERTNGLLEGMVRALDYRDTETQWHSRRVALFTRHIARQAGATEEELVVIEQGALLHDIGKIGVRDSILLKPGKLTPDEWVEMKQHPEIGWRMLAAIPFLRGAAEIVFQHQERWDGGGYPRGLKGEDMTFGARCFGIADTLDAITSDRPYRKSRPIEVAVDEIRRCGGSQFDPALVAAFLCVPLEDWSSIRRSVETLAEEDHRRWGDRPLVTALKARQGQ
jgi:response regulator RpfG family c-di-GMP phosphodiesterase